MRTIFLHVGATKTGTTALQSSFVRNKEQLREQGVVYPDADTDKKLLAGEIATGNGGEIAVTLNPDLKLGAIKGMAIPDLVDKQVRLFEETGVDKLFYSSEHMMFMKEPFLKDYVAQLRARDIALEGIIFVRNFADHALSAYTQVVKRHGYSKPLRDYLSGYYKPLFREAISAMSETLGSDGVHVISYDRFKNDVLKPIYSVLEINSVEGEISAPRINRSLSRYEIEVMRRMNMHLPHNVTKDLSDFLITALPAKAVEKKMSEQEIAVLEKRFRPDVAWINEIAGESSLVMKNQDLVVDDEEFALSEFEEIMVNVMVKLYLRQLPKGQG